MIRNKGGGIATQNPYAKLKQTSVWLSSAQADFTIQHHSKLFIDRTIISKESLGHGLIDKNNQTAYVGKLV